ncbi:MAG: hypothetical protein AAF583_01580 [Pseudomonadota bacterium]
MANELNFYGDPASQSGLTVVANIYDAAGFQVSGDIPCPEGPSSSIYVGNMPAAPAGQYGVRFFQSGVATLLATGFIDWDGANEVTTATLKDETVTLMTGQTQIEMAIAGIPTPLSAGEVNAIMDTALQSYDGPTKAELDLAEANIIANAGGGGGGDATAAAQTAILSAIGNLNDLSAADIYAEFTSGSNEDVFKADVSGLSVDLSPVLTAISALNDITAADVYTQFTSGSNEDVFKADVSGLSVDLSPILTAIGNLNDFNPSLDTVARVTLVDTTTTNTDMRGTDSISVPSASVIASEVRTDLERTGGMLGEIHTIHGLNSLSPMTVTPATRTAGSITQTIAGDGTTTSTVTRQ